MFEALHLPAIDSRGPGQTCRLRILRNSWTMRDTPRGGRSRTRGAYILAETQQEEADDIYQNSRGGTGRDRGLRSMVLGDEVYRTVVVFPRSSVQPEWQ